MPRPPEPIKGLYLATGVMTLLAIALAILFSSPDQRPSTIAQWSRQQPVGFLKTAVAELAGTSPTAEYGPPYDNGEGSVQHAAFIHLQEWLGVSHPVHTAADFVIDPLRTIPDPTLQAEVSEYEGSREFLKADGINSVEKALYKAPVSASRSVYMKPGEYENVDNIMRGLLGLAQSGGLEADLLSGDGFFQDDYTKPLLFMTDGEVIERRAQREHLPGRQWAMMDETGSYPGQVSLWPYALLYQVGPIKGSRNADLLVMLVMGALALLFVCVPFLPGVRDVPRRVPVWRLIWREPRRGG